ncbi:MAG: BrnA antitoxin family protein [Treponema sp.]|nr:BrnA antitoxin family protein [Treponema sp.]MBQ6567139.1 BrnA antitoxin family protein [Treponema sp.]MBQ7168175.1 BrnA antitoxin family protein [Treponema sp.]
MSRLEDIIAECEKNAVPDSEIDTSEIPEITDFSGFHFGNTQYFKPAQPIKEQISIRINKELLEHFRSMGKGWQAQVNDFLMAAYQRGQI